MRNLLKSKIFLSFFLSYILILMIPYGIGYFVYENSVTILTEKISQIESSALNDKVEMIDYKVNSFISSIKQLVSDDKLIYFTDMYDPYRSDDAYFSMSQLKRQIESTILNNPTVKNITVYSQKNSLMISSAYGTVYRGSKNFPYDELWGITANEYNEFLQQSGPEYLFFTNRHTGQKSIFVVIPVIISDFANPEGVVIAEMSGTNELIRGESSSGEINAFMIVNNKMQSISNQVDNLSIQDVDLEKILQLENNYSEIVQNGDYLLSYQTSNYNDWIYISLTNIASYLKEVEDYKKTVVIYVIVSSLCGIIIAVFISNKNYKPINRLKNLSSKFRVQNNANDNNDYEIIESSIDNMIHTVDNYKIYLQKQERKNTSWYFSRIIRGWNVELESDFESSELLNIKKRLESSRNRVMIYQIDDFMEMFFSSGLVIEEEGTVQIVSFIITNVLEEFFLESGALHVLAIDNDNRFVIPIVINETGEINYVEKANFIKNFLLQKFGIIGSFSISNVHYSEAGVNEGYKEAVEVIEFKDIIGDQNVVITYESLQFENENRNLMFRIEKEKIFVNFILVEDFREAKNAIYNIIDEDVAEVSSLQTLKVKLFGLIDKMMYAITNLAERSEYYSIINQELIDSLLNASSIPELKRIIDIIFSELDSTKLKSQSDHDVNVKIQDILEYIENNINNPDLNVSMIAEEFNMTISKLSKYMKKELGQGALDYIHLLRIKHAKQLLSIENNTLADIAIEVGYYNYRTLVSRFKKYEGVTPTQYREKVL